MKAILVGYGEVGKGLYEVLSKHHEICIHDPYQGFFAGSYLSASILLVAIPYTKTFEDAVKQYQKIYGTGTTIIFSSVPIGTCSRLGAIHSPIEGRHNNMAESIRKHIRWIGGASLIVENFFRVAGLITYSVPYPEITEFLKMQSTTIYGINIEWARYCKQAADKIGFDYSLLKKYNQDYNNLVTEVHCNPDLVRYNLDTPEGKIGGHCVLPNAKLLQKEKGFGHPFIQTVLDLNEDK